MRYLKKYISKYFRLFLLAVCALSFEAACDLFQPTIMSKIVDIGIKNKDLSYVLRLGGAMVLVTGIGAAAAVTRNNISSRVSQRFGADLRLDLFRKIQALSYKDAGSFETATLVTRLTNDVTQIQNLVNGMMRIFVKAPLLCIGSIVMAVILEPRLSVVIAVAVPVIVCIILLNTKVGYPLFRRVQAAVDRLNGVMREYLSGIRVVKAFNRFSFERKRFSVSNEALSDVQTSAMKVMAVFSPASTLVINLGIAAVLWYGGFGVNSGSFQVGKIIAFINYMMQISTSLVTISMVFTMFVRARASAERIGEVMNRNDAAPAGKAGPAPQTADIAFEHVCFSYNGNQEEPVLNDITFTVEKGKTVGIIGTTGSGKTSLVNLIPRFYDPTSGYIRIGGENILNLDEHALRERIAVVPQKSTLFTGTIAENIRWGRPDATDREVQEAAGVAQAHDFVAAFPEGYRTVLGQGGVNLSGGQKQRLSIARALLKKPDVLILDDSTSAVDVITEQKIRSGLRNYSADLTCIIVAQRISSVMSADKIIVLDNGRIVGLGSHKSLLNSCEIYREIFRSQFGGEAV